MYLSQSFSKISIRKQYTVHTVNYIMSVRVAFSCEGGELQSKKPLIRLVTVMTQCTQCWGVIHVLNTSNCNLLNRLNDWDCEARKTRTLTIVKALQLKLLGPDICHWVLTEPGWEREMNGSNDKFCNSYVGTMLLFIVAFS